MTIDDELPDDGGFDRRRWLLVGAGALVAAILIVVAAVALSGGDDGDDADDPASSTTALTSLPATSAAGSSTSTAATSTSTSAAPGTTVVSATTVAPATTAAPAPTTVPATTLAPVEPGPVVTEFPPLSMPSGSIPGSTEVEVCASIIDTLGEYRQLAVDNPIPAIKQLLPGMEQFELDVFTAADLQEWGDQIVEQLVNVRREWSTALSADESGEAAEAQTRADNALEFLDAAIAVPCPEG